MVLHHARKVIRESWCPYSGRGELAGREVERGDLKLQVECFENAEGGAHAVADDDDWVKRKSQVGKREEGRR
jgi:hypothetical protein